MKMLENAGTAGNLIYVVEFVMSRIIIFFFYVRGVKT